LVHQLSRAEAGLKAGLASSAAIVVLCLSLVPACSKKGGASDDEVKAAEVPSISAEVAKVTRQPITRVLIVRGTVATAPNEDVKVSSLVAGRIVTMLVAEGDTVRKGQVLAELERRPFEDQRRQAAAALDQAKATLENAKLNLDRNERLFKQGIAAGKEVEDARSQFATAQAGLEQATAALDIASRQIERANVASPIAGQVMKRLMSAGEQVDGTGAQPIVEVANLDAVELDANIPAEYLASVRTGQTVSISCDTFPGRDFEGQVIAIAPAVDPASNSALGRMRIKNAGRLLKVGMFAQARVPVEAHKDALTVPPSAVVRDQEGTFLYVLNGDVAERKPVTLGIETPEAVEVVSGVTEGQGVLTSNIHGLGEKAKLVKGS
jgi:RND family efflux transporter MFP subunit